MRIALLVTALMIMGGMNVLTVSMAHAEPSRQAINVDLVLPATLASSDAPFYQEAQVKIGDQMIPVTQGALPSGVLAQYQPENKAIIISNAISSSEEEKGQALLDVVAAIQANTIIPAAGR